MITVAEQKRVLRVAELVGPAGAGKSTVLRALVSRYTAVPKTIWGQSIPLLLSTGVQLGPTLLPFWRESGSLLWPESRHVIRLRALHRTLTRDPRPGEQVTVFDEGPVFALAWLRGFGHESMRSESSDLWWRSTLHSWARLIDAVVVLDAPDSVLARRIRTRSEWHEIKGEPDWYITEWLGRFRSALDWVLAGFAIQGGPAVIRISAEREEASLLAERVAQALDRIHDH
jgi:predicted ATPase